MLFFRRLIFVFFFKKMSNQYVSIVQHFVATNQVLLFVCVRACTLACLCSFIIFYKEPIKWNEINHVSNQPIGQFEKSKNSAALDLHNREKICSCNSQGFYIGQCTSSHWYFLDLFPLANIHFRVVFLSFYFAYSFSFGDRNSSELHGFVLNTLTSKRLLWVFVTGKGRVTSLS